MSTLASASPISVGRTRRGAVGSEFTEFTDEVTDIYQRLAPTDDGAFAVSVCTVDGQRFSVGDARDGFCVQSVCKPVNYCLALQAHGPERVHRFVGYEPSGQAFNALVLAEDGLPHNPMINSGAIMCCSLLASHHDPAAGFEYIMDTWRRLTDSTRPAFDANCFRSETESAERNFAIGELMMDAFPAGAELGRTLELYLRCCSIELDAESLAVAAAAFANGGRTPLTGRRIFSPATVRRCLSLLSLCGMYDYSGQFAYSVGLPAKSGVSGAIMVVIPNVLGVCVFSPRLDRRGNSVRGIQFCRELASRFAFHPYYHGETGTRRRSLSGSWGASR